MFSLPSAIQCPAPLAGDCEIAQAKFLETRIKDLICVSQPYYALRNLEQLGDGTLQCEILVENISSGESTLVSAAEAGRHLAILGSCALASCNPVVKKHYYLANQAYLERPDDAAEIFHAGEPRSVRLFARARAVHLDLENKVGKAETGIFTEEGKLIFSLDVNYQVLRAELFRKLFKRNHIEHAALNGENPYVETIKFESLARHQDILLADLGIIPAQQCIGHFDGCPALPVAVLSSALVKLGGMHMKEILGDVWLRHAVKSVKLTASRLAFAGEHVSIRSRFLRKAGDEYVFHVKAENEQMVECGSIEIAYACFGVERHDAEPELENRLY